MSQAQVISRRKPSRLVEGTKQVILNELASVDENTRLRLVISGDELSGAPELASSHQGGNGRRMTFRQLVAPAATGFDGVALSDDELSAFVEADVKAYRAERRDAGIRG